ncbi:50S ribosomal protein L31e [Tardisphaera miroshnichenkoae]
MPEQKEYVISLKLARFKHGKKRAPHAIRILQEAIKRRIKEGEVKLDPELNSFVWSKGIRNFPKKVEVVAEREKSDEPWIVKLKTQKAEAPKSEEGVKKEGASGESIAQGN